MVVGVGSESNRNSGRSRNKGSANAGTSQGSEGSEATIPPPIISKQFLTQSTIR